MDDIRKSVYRAMRRIAVLMICAALLCTMAGTLSGCGGNDSSGNDSSAAAGETQAESSEPAGDSSAAFTHLEPADAAAMIEEGDCILVDTRGEPSYDYEHIPGSICVPVDSEDSYIEEKLPDKGAKILLYCDYGGLSKQMGDHMALDLGYTNIYEFDGLLVWEGELEGDAH